MKYYVKGPFLFLLTAGVFLKKLSITLVLSNTSRVDVKTDRQTETTASFP